MSESDKIIKMLGDTSIEKRIAACIVLGELRVKSPAAVSALLSLLDSQIHGLERHALLALANAGAAKKVLPRAMTLMTSQVADVRDAAAFAIRTAGEDAVPIIRERLGVAGPDERRALEATLAELGGKDAFSTLLQGIVSKSSGEKFTHADNEALKAATLAVRQHVKASESRDRKTYVTETEKFLEKQAKAKAAPEVIVAAIKILGYLEEERAVPTLLAYATNKAAPGAVRQEALIALRFAIAKTRDVGNVKIIDALLSAAESPDRSLAHTALHTLSTLEVPANAMKRMEKLLAHEDAERARFALAYLATQKSESATSALVTALTTLDRKRAEMAAESLSGREDAAAPLAKSLLSAKDADRAWLIRKVLQPMAKRLPTALRTKLLDEAVARLIKTGREWEALEGVVRESDPERTTTALREAAQKLKKQGQHERAASVLMLVCKTDKSTDADRFDLAALELKRSALDTRSASRANDPALHRLSGLLARKFDAATALRKDRSLELDHLYYVGFHFAEDGHPLGEELLSFVRDKGGKTKIAKMAKNKLALVNKE